MRMIYTDFFYQVGRWVANGGMGEQAIICFCLQFASAHRILKKKIGEEDIYIKTNICKWCW